MNLREKLDRYSGTAGLKDVPELQATSFSAGDYEHSTHVFAREYSHGSLAVENLGGRFPNVQMVAPQLVKNTLDIERIAFVDTETTGLSGGVGVCAFLIGVGFLSPSGFVIEQFLMRDFPGEPAMLDAVCNKLEQFDCIASYNGRSFDIPILQGRLVLNGISRTLSAKSHIDMLHPARRLWKHRLPDCSLKSLEIHALGCNRGEDIEGWLIPQTYFAYLQSGNRRLLEQILHHNRMDLLSLAGITSLALKAINYPEQAPFEHGEDWYGLGTLFEHHRHREKAAFCFERAMHIGLPQSLNRRCRRILSLTHKRAGNWEQAAKLWADTSAYEAGAAIWFELEELAKYHEHRQRDLLSARDICRRAITALEIKAATSNEDVSDNLAGFEHRLSRIEQKIQREKSCAR